MLIDNHGNCYKIWLTRLGITVVFAFVILGLILIPWFSREEAAIDKYVLVIITAGLYALISLWFMLQQHHYVYFSDEGDRIILRFYPLGALNRKKSSIEIPKKQLVKYELEPFLSGQQHRLVLYQNFRNKVSRYPAVSLSALSKVQQKALIGSLQQLLSRS